VQRRGDEQWWECHVAQQPEHIPTQLCTVLLEGDAAPVAELLLVRARLMTEGMEKVVSIVGEEEEQAQEFAVDAPKVNMHADNRKPPVSFVDRSCDN